LIGSSRPARQQRHTAESGSAGQHDAAIEAWIIRMH
jgi:hypothetical protein